MDDQTSEIGETADETGCSSSEGSCSTTLKKLLLKKLLLKKLLLKKKLLKLLRNSILQNIVNRKAFLTYCWVGLLFYFI